MQNIIQEFLAWKSGHDDSYVYDEIHNFYAALTPAEMLRIMAFIIDSQNNG